MNSEEFIAFCFGFCFASLVFMVMMACLDTNWRRTAIKYDIGGYNPKTSHFELKPLNENK